MSGVSDDKPLRRANVIPQYIYEVLALCLESGATFNALYWDDNDGSLGLRANCNDFFWWGVSDSEDVAEADVEPLHQALRDTSAAGSPSLAMDLLVARKRGMRPQRPCYEDWSPEIAALFDACGPERDPSDEG